MKRFALVVIAALLLVSAAFPGLRLVSWAQDRDTPDPVHAPQALPGVEPRMLTAEYWIELQDNPDEVLMTPERIEAWNARVRTKKIDLSDRHGRQHPLVSYYDVKRQVGLFMHPILPLEQPATVPGDSLRAWIADNLDYVRSRDFYDGRRVKYNDEMIGELVEKMNLDAIPRTVTRRFGTIVRRGDIRLVPTHIPGYPSERSAGDHFQNTSIYLPAPVTVLHETVDGDYYYVESPVARGWILSSHVALGEKDDISWLAATDDMLIATANKIPVYADPACSVFERYLYFSGHVPFVREMDEACVVMLPERKHDGALGISDGYIEKNADVHRGYLPYTKRNVATQMFKLLHQPYGWADMLGNRDCSGTMRVLFRCFGFTMGRWPNFELLAPPDEHIMVIDRDLSTEEKLEKAAQKEPLITLAGSGGHISLWLGRAHNGNYYFIHEAGWGYREGDQMFWVNQVNINEATHSWWHIDRIPVFSTMLD